MPQDVPDPLELLRAASGLSVDGEGRFLHRGEPITHARTLAVLWGSLQPGEGGRWLVRVGRETALVTVEETPWVVRGLRLLGEPPAGATLLLAGGAEVPLDPGAVRVGADGVLRCRLPGGAEARCSRAGQLALGDLLEEDPAGSGGWRLRLGGAHHGVPGSGTP